MESKAKKQKEEVGEELTVARWEGKICYFIQRLVRDLAGPDQPSGRDNPDKERFLAWEHWDEFENKIDYEGGTRLENAGAWRTSIGDDGDRQRAWFPVATWENEQEQRTGELPAEPNGEPGMAHGRAHQEQHHEAWSLIFLTITIQENESNLRQRVTLSTSILLIIFILFIINALSWTQVPPSSPISAPAPSLAPSHPKLSSHAPSPTVLPKSASCHSAVCASKL